MTPPDSGERRQGKSHLHIGKECGPSCPPGNGIEFKPDSGEREVPSHTVTIGWPTIRKLAGEGAVHFAEQDVALVAADDLFNGPYPLPDDVFLQRFLAQRILAALEDPGLRQTYGFVTNALAAELRAIVERKT